MSSSAWGTPSRGPAKPPKAGDTQANGAGRPKATFANSKKKKCLAYRQGKCARGGSCRFSHAEAQEQKSTATPQTLPVLLVQIFRGNPNSALSFRMRILLSRCLSLPTVKAKQLVQDLSGVQDGELAMATIGQYIKPFVVNDSAHIRSFVGSFRGVMQNLGLKTAFAPAIYCTDDDSDEDAIGEEKKQEEAAVVVTVNVAQEDASSPPPPELSYLDVGVGQGHLAAAVGQLLQARVSGLDVVDFPNNVIKEQTRIYDGTRIPFPDSSFDFVSAFQVLHHVDQNRELLREIFRVIKPGGSLILKEHDVCDSLTHKLTLLEHALHDHRRTALGLTHLIEHPTALKSKAQWDVLLMGCGFVEYQKPVFEGWTMSAPQENSDPTRCFFARWLKPE